MIKVLATIQFFIINIISSNYPSKHVLWLDQDFSGLYFPQMVLIPRPCLLQLLTSIIHYCNWVFHIYIFLLNFNSPFLITLGAVVKSKVANNQLVLTKGVSQQLSSSHLYQQIRKHQWHWKTILCQSLEILLTTWIQNWILGLHKKTAWIAGWRISVWKLYILGQRNLLGTTCLLNFITSCLMVSYLYF